MEAADLEFQEAVCGQGKTVAALAILNYSSQSVHGS